MKQVRLKVNGQNDRVRLKEGMGRSSLIQQLDQATET